MAIADEVDSQLAQIMTSYIKETDARNPVHDCISIRQDTLRRILVVYVALGYSGPFPANSERILGPIAASRRSRFSGVPTSTSENRFHSSVRVSDSPVETIR